MNNRDQVLRGYKELLRLMKKLPSEQSAKSLDEARITFRQHKTETDKVKQTDLLKQMVARIGFLRMITPKAPGEQSSIGTGRYVLRNGELVPGSGETAGSRAADGTISMEEARQRHQKLLQRQHFGRAPPSYNPSSF